jgi:hypothetical protein
MWFGISIFELYAIILAGTKLTWVIFLSDVVLCVCHGGGVLFFVGMLVKTNDFIFHDVYWQNELTVFSIRFYHSPGSRSQNVTAIL